VGMAAAEPVRANRKASPAPSRPARPRKSEDYVGPTAEELGSPADDQAALGRVSEIETAMRPRRLERAGPRDVARMDEGIDRLEDGIADPSDRFLSQLDDIKAHLERRTSRRRSPPPSRTE